MQAFSIFDEVVVQQARRVNAILNFWVIKFLLIDN